MKCPLCKKGETSVLESRQTEGGLRRRRECSKCGKRVTTYERMETTNLLVVKRAGGRELFSRDKLRNGILHACEKRPVSREQIDKIIDRVEEEAKKARSGEIQSRKLGELVMRELKRVDKVAYIRFASVYLDFKDPDDFREALKQVK